VYTGILLESYETNEGPVYDAEFHPNGRFVAAAVGGVVDFWSVDPFGPELINESFSLLPGIMQSDVDRNRIRLWELSENLFQ
jgi:WD40 repeat protein